MTNIKIVVAIVLGILFAGGSNFKSNAQPPAPYEVHYSPQNFAPALPSQNLVLDSRQDTVFAANTICWESVPWEGYPSHSGMVKGVNDTCWISLQLFNRTTNDVDIRYESPENWVIPYTYKCFADLMDDKPNADTSSIEFSISHWRNHFFGSGGRPDTLFSFYKDKFRYNPDELVFKAWGLPIGLNVIEFKKTSSAPANLDILVQKLNSYWYSSGTDIRDSINAYIRLSKRYLELDESTLALSWADSVFSRNDSSLAGWINMAGIKYKLAENTGRLDAYNRVISIYENNNDPLIDLADSTLAISYRLWADYYYGKIKYAKWNFLNGDSLRILY